RVCCYDSLAAVFVLPCVQEGVFLMGGISCRETCSGLRVALYHISIYLCFVCVDLRDIHIVRRLLQLRRSIEWIRFMFWEICCRRLFKVFCLGRCYGRGVLKLLPYCLDVGETAQSRKGMLQALGFGLFLFYCHAWYCHFFRTMYR
ncbi:unnamed protein product, partial [Ectocarpus sp. 12 AP-2014]